MAYPLVNEIGKKYGKLTITSRAEKNDSDGRVQWVCSCKCGGEAIVMGYTLRRNRASSCGCLRTVGVKKVEKKHNSVHRSSRVRENNSCRPD
jgi:hypothetical protein